MTASDPTVSARAAQARAETRLGGLARVDRAGADRVIQAAERRAAHLADMIAAGRYRRCRVCGGPLLIAPASWPAHGVCDPSLLAQPKDR